MKARKILITGAGGHIGKLLTRALLSPEAAQENELILWLHAESHDQFAAKKELLESGLAKSAGVEYAAGDISQEAAFDTVDRRSIDTIVHLASQTKFNLPKNLAQCVNVEGASRLLRFAEGCPNLQNIVFVSSIYASGLGAGLVPEARVPKCQFANNYEWSKWQAEETLLNDHHKLPWQMVRLATVIADDNEGTVSQQNVFHHTLKLFYYGLLSLVPGHPSTPLYFISGRLATDALVQTIVRPSSNHIYNVCQSIDETVSLGELIDLSFACFAQEKEFSRRRVMPPLFVDATAFRLVTEASQGFRDEILKQALANIEPFAPQLFVRKEVANHQTRTLLGGDAAIDSRALIAASIKAMVTTKWGRA